MEILFTNCWVGDYQGEGSYEGNYCPDVLITNVPKGITRKDLFDYYLIGLNDGYYEYDKTKYKSKVITDSSTIEISSKITSKSQLKDCDSESLIEVDYNELLNWIDDYLE